MGDWDVVSTTPAPVTTGTPTAAAASDPWAVVSQQPAPQKLTNDQVRAQAMNRNRATSQQSFMNTLNQIQGKLPGQPSQADSANLDTPGMAAARQWIPTLGGTGRAIGALASDVGSTAKSVIGSAIPKNKQDLAIASIPLAGPSILAARNMVTGYRQAEDSLMDTAQKEAEQGDTTGSMINSVAAGLPLVGPLVGGIYEQAKQDPAAALGTAGSRIPQIMSMQEPAGTKGAFLSESSGRIPNPGAAIARGVGAGAQLAGEKLGLVDPVPTKLFTSAVKPKASNFGWKNTSPTAMAEMKAVESQTGKPIQSLDDALDAAKIAKQRIWQRGYDPRLGQASGMGATFDGGPVADAMMQSIDPRTAAQNPNLSGRIAQVADTYRRPMNVFDAEDYLQSANKELNSYYAKNKVGRAAALGDPETAYKVAEAEALRDQLYSKLDQVAGPGAADLKQRYGALTNVENEMMSRKNVLDRQNPQSLSEQVGAWRGAGRIVKGVATFNPADVLEGTTDMAVSRYLKQRNSTDAMIGRAFKKTQPAAAPVGAIPQQPAGLLQRGPLQTPPPQPAPPTQPGIPPQYYTTRAQRLGRLLPAQTSINLPAGAPIEGEYMSPPVDATTKAQRFGRLLPAQTSIPLASSVPSSIDTPSYANYVTHPPTGTAVPEQPVATAPATQTPVAPSGFPQTQAAAAASETAQPAQGTAFRPALSQEATPESVQPVSRIPKARATKASANPAQSTEPQLPGLQKTAGSLYDRALEIAERDGSASANVFQKEMGISFGSAVRLMDILEENKIVGPAEGTGPRPLLHNLEEMRESESAQSPAHGTKGVSAEEFARDHEKGGINYFISKTGQSSVDAKSFNPGATNPDSVHVTVFNDGTFRTNAGAPTTIQQAAIKALMKELKEGKLKR